MNMLASGFENFINGIFAEWQMLLFGVAAVLLLLTIAFRKFKLTAIILSLAALAIGGVLLADLIIEAISWDLPDLVAFAVKWVPTVLFTATVLLSTLIGLKRGLRKSLILLAHEVGAAAVCITAYLILVRLPAVNKFVLKTVDFFMGGEGSLARALKVDAKCSGIKEVFVEWLPTVIKGDFAIMLGGSKAYIYTLADLIYRVAFALVMYIAFLLLDFIMYIIYLCCYSERKYKEKIQKKYVENKVDRRYSKHHTGGGAVGLVRGIAIGLISMSFLGSALYIVAGRGDGKMKDFDFGDKNINEYYSVYRSVESYGTYGIFKVLNSVSSTDDVPYYLFAADLVFSGELDDEEFGISDNVVFREELAAYTDFARDTMELLLRYGGDEIKSLIQEMKSLQGNKETVNKAFNTVVNVMSGESFRAEFNDLISEFDQKTYVINFAMSFVNTAIANIDDMSFASGVSAESRELLKILFTKGYLSDSIPDEYRLKYMLEGSGIEVIQPYINVSKLVNKRDVQTVFNIVIDVLGNGGIKKGEELKFIAEISPKIKDLSLLGDDKAEEIDPVLGRLYCYAANTYLTEEGSEGVEYADIYREHISWTSEINALLNVADSVVTLYDNCFKGNADPMTALAELFNKNAPAYSGNMECFDAITDCALNSRVFGKVLSTSKLYKIIENALSGQFNEIYIPHGLMYENEYSDGGELVRTGETFNLFNGVGAIGKNSELFTILKNFDKENNGDMKNFLNTLSETVNKEDGDYLISDYIVSSEWLRSVFSAAIVDYCGKYMYVPTVAFEKDADDKPVNLINAEELTVLFDNISELVALIDPLLETPPADMKNVIADFIENKREVFDALLGSSTIFEGTMALHLVKELDKYEAVVIPQALKTSFDGWATENGANGELKNFLNALDAAGIDVPGAVRNGFNVDSVLDNFASDEFTEENLQTCLKSQVLHYSLSGYLTGEEHNFGSFKLIVPAAARQEPENDSISALVRSGELKNIIKLVKTFGLTSDKKITVSDVLKKLVQEENKKLLSESYVLSASVVGSLIDDEDVKAMITLPEKFEAAATAEKLNKFNSSNPWNAEIVRLINALDEVLGISEAGDEFDFDKIDPVGKMKKFITVLNEPSALNAGVSRLTVCYASEVVRSSITAELDEMISGKIDEKLSAGAKSNGYYTENELRSLSNALKIFEIDLEKIGGESLAEKITDKIFTLNAPAPEGFEGTKLSAVYPSVIFSGIMSKSLDDVLLNSDGEGGTVELIDKNVLFAIKGGLARYAESQIAELIDSFNAIGIKDFKQLENLDLDNALSGIGDREMDVVCASRIMRGVFTKQLSENNTLNVDHPLAFEEDVKILKSNEIKAIKNLAGNMDNVEETYFDSVLLGRLEENLFAEDGEVKSYLLLKAASDSITAEEKLVVDARLIDRYDCVEKGEMQSLIKAFKAMFGEDASISSIQGGVEYPDAEKRGKILESRIACTTLIDTVVEKNNVEGNFIKKENEEVFTRYGRTDESYSLSQDQINYLFDALDVINKNSGTFSIPSRITLTDLIEYRESLDVLYKSDIIRYKICDTILATPAGAVPAGVDLTPSEETASDIKTHTVQTKKALEYEQVYSFVNSYNI